MNSGRTSGHLPTSYLLSLQPQTRLSRFPIHLYLFHRLLRFPLKYVFFRIAMRRKSFNWYQLKPVKIKLDEAVILSDKALENYLKAASTLQVHPPATHTLYPRAFLSSTYGGNPMRLMTHSRDGTRHFCFPPPTSIHKCWMFPEAPACCSRHVSKCWRTYGRSSLGSRQLLRGGSTWDNTRTSGRVFFRVGNSQSSDKGHVSFPCYLGLNSADGTD